MADWNRERFPHGITTIRSTMPLKENHCVISPMKTSSPIDRLKRIFTFRESSPKSNKKEKKKQKKIERTVRWQEDENAVRAGTCIFHVKYLGCIEVQESRGIHICEQAIQSLLKMKNKHIKAVLHVSGDTLRVVDEINKGIVVDQTIEKVSFCAPHRRHEKGFAYICRDGTTRRWLCHAFLTIQQTGEHLSHTVGFAFQVCLERKQKRDRDCQVSIEYTPCDTSYTRLGSFRPLSITERMIDPQSAQIAEPVPPTPPNPTLKSIERARPKGNHQDLFNRSWSMDAEDCKRNLFRRQSSLSPSDLPLIKSNNPLTQTIIEDVELTTTTINEIPSDSTNTFTQNRFECPPKTFSSIPFSTSDTNENLLFFSSPPYSPSEPIEFFNPFSSYAYSTSMIYAQSSILSPAKHGTNPFDDDVIRR